MWEDLSLVLSFDSFCFEGGDNLKSELWVCKWVLLRSSELKGGICCKAAGEAMGVDFRVREFLFTAVAATLIGLLCLFTYQKASGVPNFDLLNHQPREDTELVRIFLSFFLSFFILMPPHVIVV